MKFPTENILIIAEKPSLALAIAKELPSKYEDKRSYLDCGNFKIAKLAGHVLQLYEPDDYHPSYEKWNLDVLPILPEEFMLKPSKEVAVNTVKDLLLWSNEVWNAGDPDREGQLLVDELLEYLDYSGKTRRLLVSDTSSKGVQKALSNVVDNSKYYDLYQAAKCRSHTDWLLGINMTRLITLLAREKGYHKTISVGRVQIAILGLIVRRYKAINNFKSIPYYDLEIRLNDLDFHLENKLLPRQEFLDDSYRIIDKNYAESLQRNLVGEEARLEKEVKETEKNHPFCFSLAMLQKEAADTLHFKSSETLELAQSLYEKHKLITYPRSDCKYLPEEQFSESASIFEQVIHHFPDLSIHKDKIDFSIRSVTWNTKNVTAHFAIIPNNNDKADFHQLTSEEQSLYRLISVRYIQQFLPKQKQIDTELRLFFKDDSLQFKAIGKEIIEKGWSILSVSSEKTAKEAPSSDKFKAGDLFRITKESITLLEKQTKPPLLFTESTLLTAINNAKRYLQNKDRKVENFALGTPATQSDMLKKIYERGYIVIEKNNYIPTKTGIELIELLPDVLTYPDLTVLWEERFLQIEKGELSREEFEKRITTMVEKFTVDFKKSGVNISSDRANVLCPVCKSDRMYEFSGKDRNGKSYIRFSCKKEDCKATLYNSFLDKKFTSDFMQNLLELLSSGESALSKSIKLKSKSGNTFSAKVGLKIEGNELKYYLVYDDKKNKNTKK